MVKKLTLTIFMLTCSLLAPASAQTGASSEKQTVLKEFVFLMNGDNKVEETMSALTAQAQASQEATAKSLLDERTDLTAAERQSLENALISDKKNSFKHFFDKLMRRINYNEIMNEILYISYDKHFTLEEIKELNAFYKTPTGQKSIKTTPAIAADMMQMIHERLMPKMQIIMKELQDEERLEIEQKINAKKPRPKKKAAK
jgi:hypothetical protein